MARYRSRAARGTPREFEWVHSAGAEVVPFGEGVPGTGSWDLLAGARSRWGEGALRGATVVSVKGYIAPVPTNGYTGLVDMFGTFGIRVTESTLPDPEDLEEFPTPTGIEEQSWQFLSSFHLFEPELWGTLPPDMTISTAHPTSSPWVVDVRSNRRIKQIGQTLGLFVAGGSPPPGTSDTNIYWSLRVGLKLA